MARLFVSDVHLDAGAPEAITQFLHFLGAQAKHAEALYILGDLFESWVGDDDADPAKARVCAALGELAFLAGHPALMADVDNWRTW